jgi:hypothetical protein
MLTDSARELPILLRPIARSHYCEAPAIEQALRADTIKEGRGRLPEVPLETLRITAIATTDYPEAASFPSLDDQGKGSAAFQQRPNATRIDL